MTAACRRRRRRRPLAPLPACPVLPCSECAHPACCRLDVSVPFPLLLTTQCQRSTTLAPSRASTCAWSTARGSPCMAGAPGARPCAAAPGFGSGDGMFCTWLLARVMPHCNPAPRCDADVLCTPHAAPARPPWPTLPPPQLPAAGAPAAVAGGHAVRAGGADGDGEPAGHPLWHHHLAGGRAHGGRAAAHRCLPQRQVGGRRCLGCWLRAARWDACPWLPTRREQRCCSVMRLSDRPSARLAA